MPQRLNVWTSRLLDTGKHVLGHDGDCATSSKARRRLTQVSGQIALSMTFHSRTRMQNREQNYDMGGVPGTDELAVRSFLQVD